MTKKAKPRIFLETSGVISELHGHSLQQAAVRSAVGDGRVEISNFIRMEYLRGLVLNLIELYFLIEECDTVSDALIDWSQKVAQERKLKIVLMTIAAWITNQEEWQAKEKSLRRLGDYIVRQVYTFDETFSRRSRDPMRCQLGRFLFPKRTFHPEMLLDFYDRFKTVQRGVPNCDLCLFRDRQRRFLLAQGIDLYSPVRRDEFRRHRGYVVQAERLNEAEATTETAPRCRWCERLGDAIIALHTPPKALLVTADRAFIPFGQILKREVKLLPSLAELKRQIAEQGSVE
jgi:hypothetical protein